MANLQDTIWTSEGQRVQHSSSRTQISDSTNTVRNKQKNIFILGKIDMDNIAETCRKYDHAATIITKEGYHASVFTRMNQTAWMHNIKGEIQQRLKHMLMCDGIYLLDDWVDCSICIALHLLAAQAKMEIINK